jgi:hypothetical protein
VKSSKATRKTAAEAIDILTQAYQSPAYLEKTVSKIAEMKQINVSCLLCYLQKKKLYTFAWRIEV